MFGFSSWFASSPNPAPRPQAHRRPTDPPVRRRAVRTTRTTVESVNRNGSSNPSPAGPVIDMGRDPATGQAIIMAIYDATGVHPDEWRTRPEKFELILETFASEQNAGRDINEVLAEYRLDRNIYPAPPGETYRCACSKIITQYHLTTNQLNGNVLMIGTTCRDHLLEAEEPNAYDITDGFVVADHAPIQYSRLTPAQEREYQMAT
jgi:hypothetical protein